jgi:hypothetical protein
MATNAIDDAARRVYEWWEWNVGWRLFWRRADMSGVNVGWKA